MIYFIQAAESKKIKIGFSAGNPKQRLNTMQVGCPEDLTLIFHIEGNKEDERKLHEQFAECVENGLNVKVR